MFLSVLYLGLVGQGVKVFGEFRQPCWWDNGEEQRGPLQVRGRRGPGQVQALKAEPEPRALHRLALRRRPPGTRLPAPARPPLPSSGFLMEPGILLLETPRTPLQSWAPSLLLQRLRLQLDAVAVAGPLRPSPGSRERRARLWVPSAGRWAPGSPGAARLGAGGAPLPRPAPLPVMQPPCGLGPLGYRRLSSSPSQA